MEAFLEFFETMPSWQKLVWIFICLSFNWILEGGFPLVSLNYKKWRHAGVNLIFLSCSMVINVLFGVATVGVFAWLATSNFGLLHLFELPIWVELLIALLILDLVAQYFVHYLLHKVKWMWKFHMVHHSDSKVDATTGTRTTLAITSCGKSSPWERLLLPVCHWHSTCSIALSRYFSPTLRTPTSICQCGWTKP